jgi:hypothetical protein
MKQNLAVVNYLYGEAWRAILMGRTARYPATGGLRFDATKTLEQLWPCVGI